ncbi:flagellin [Niveispirillum sp. KHB5.9]|uniref:flagellin n=1 Tax=Niveispirillum sp. KHB5.9 TaxID=3400269 RepID=UPI003A8948C6
MSVNLPASLRSTTMMLRTLTADQNSALKRLASGQKINSAIEGPQQFFKARDLNQKAGDLDKLKSGIAQAISTLQAASKGVESVKAMMDQARGLTSVALSTLDNTPGAIAARKSLAEQFNTILEKVDEIVGDSSYGGKNLLRAQPATYSATDESLREAAEITGITKVEMTGVIRNDDYRIEVLGGGDITGEAADIVATQDAMGLAQLTVGGVNSLTAGRMDNIKFELHGTPGRDARLVVLDGDESWTTSLTQEQLIAAADSGNKIQLTHEFRSGAQINMLVDGNSMRNALQPAGVVKAEVRRDIDLSISVTNNKGVTITRDASTQDSSSRLREGENSFRFDEGTVRLSIDPARIQDAAIVTGGIYGNLGVLKNALTRGPAVTRDLEDNTVRLEVEKYGFGANAVALNQYVKPGGQGATTWSYSDTTSGTVIIGGNDPLASTAAAGIQPGSLAGVTSSATFVVNRNPGQGGLSTVADGDWDDGELTNPYVRGWQRSVELNVVYGETINGKRTVSVTDGLGGKFNGTVEDKGDGQPSVIRLSGGVNNGATIGLFHKDATAGSRTIEIYTGQDSWVTASDAASMQQVNFDDIPDWTGFRVDTALNISVGGPDSAGVGSRNIIITQTSIDTGEVGTEIIPIGNAGFTDLIHTLTTGPNAGAKIHFDVPGNGVDLNYRVAAMRTTPFQATTLVVRSAADGETATVSTRQNSVATPENDLTVNFNADGSSALDIKAVRVDSGPLGLGVDRSANGWRDRSDVYVAMQDLTRADARLETATRSLQVNMDILGARDTFSSEFSTVLRSGARNLIATDEHAESAQVLTANVRSQLATTMVSLMVQQQQRILGLF